jgi:hypothetical protein
MEQQLLLEPDALQTRPRRMETAAETGGT